MRLSELTLLTLVALGEKSAYRAYVHALNGGLVTARKGGIVIHVLSIVMCILHGVHMQGERGDQESIAIIQAGGETVVTCASNDRECVDGSDYAPELDEKETWL